MPDCTRRSIVYESICIKCNPGAMRAGPLLVPEASIPSIYVGESSRSIFERSGEHWRSYSKRNPDSHIWKHHLIHHGGEGEPEMMFKIVGNYRTALTRQITEAIRIRKRGTSVLNSKGEYDRCRIHRLTIGSENKPDGGTITTEKEGNNNEDVMGEQLLWGKRKAMDKGRVQRNEDLGYKSKKRGNIDDVLVGGRPTKKRKFVLISEEWGKGLGKEDQGLDMKRGAGPLQGNSTIVIEDESTSRIENQPENLEGYSQLPNEGDRNKEGGTGPLDHTNTFGEQDGMVASSSSKKPNKTQLSITQFVKKVDRGDTRDRVGETQPRLVVENLYDTANNVNMLRDMRGDCVVRNNHCQEHDRPARKVTSVKSIWTKNVKTGIFGYRRKKLSVLRCNGTMGTLVRTMGTRDGVGSNDGTFAMTG